MAHLDQSLPPLATLAAFEAAVRHRNFTRAAEELYLSQASVSRRIRQLEADLGIELFERHRHDVTPTTEAEILVVSVRLALGELASTAEKIRSRAAGADSLTVLSSLALTSAVVAPVLGELQRNHPDLNIRVLSACEPIEATRERFDIAIQYGPSECRSFAVEFIADEAIFPVCSPGFAAGLRSPLSASDVRKLPLLDVDYDDPTWTTWQDFLAAEVGDTPGGDTSGGEQRMVFSSYQVCLDVAERGDGMALGWERSVGPRLDAGTLVRVPGLTMSNAALINAYLPNGAVSAGDRSKRAGPNPRAVELLDLLKQALR